MTSARIGIIMGSESDYEVMAAAEDILIEFGVAYEIQVVSAHRTPDLMYRYAKEAEGRGLEILIAGAGGAAHLPGMVSALTHLPVLGVPVTSKALQGLDSLLSIVQMPAGVPTATFAIGRAGATNAALFALRMLAIHDGSLRRKLEAFSERRAQLALAGNSRVQGRWESLKMENEK